MLKDSSDRVETVYDLGSVTTETKGPGGFVIPDAQNELRNSTGIADD